MGRREVTISAANSGTVRDSSWFSDALPTAALGGAQGLAAGAAGGATAGLLYAALDGISGGSGGTTKFAARMATGAAIGLLSGAMIGGHFDPPKRYHWIDKAAGGAFVVGSLAGATGATLAIAKKFSSGQPTSLARLAASGAAALLIVGAGGAVAGGIAGAFGMGSHYGILPNTP